MKLLEKIIIVALALILIFQVVLNVKMNEMNRSLSDRVNSMQNTIMSMQGNVTAQVSNVMNQIQDENAVIKEVRWEMVGKSNGLVKVHCEVGLNKVGKNIVPYLLYRTSGSENWEKIQFTSNVGLNFSTNISLKPQDLYEYQVFIEGETNYSGNIEMIPDYIYSYMHFQGELLGDYNPNVDNSKTRIYVQMTPISKVEITDLQIKQAEVVLYNNGKVIDDIPMNSIADDKAQNSTSEGITSNNTAVATSQMIYGGMNAEINFADYKTVVDRITVKATYNDGFIVEKEVFPMNMK